MSTKYCLIWLFIYLITIILADNPINKCPKLAPRPPPTSIKNLRPDDVNVVMALGDSITAAFGLQGASGELNEYRGQSWAIGGDSGATTLPNFFNHFTNKPVQGASRGNHFVEVCLGPSICPGHQYHPELDQLNAAQSGAWIQNLLYQISFLKQQIKNNPNIDMNKDWKVLTILIGPNNLCEACYDDYSIYDSAEAFEKSLNQVVKELQTIPRLFVNLVSIFNISGVYTIALNNTYCRTLHNLLFWECDCAFIPFSGEAHRKRMDDTAAAYRDVMRKVASQTPVTDSFALIVQPMFTNLIIPGLEFLSTLDCFHPSLVAHQNMAIGLWDTMLLPAKDKPIIFQFPVPLICPTNDTLLYTY